MAGGMCVIGVRKMPLNLFLCQLFLCQIFSQMNDFALLHCKNTAQSLPHSKKRATTDFTARQATTKNESPQRNGYVQFCGLLCIIGDDFNGHVSPFQQIRVTSKPSNRPSLSILSAMWPTPTAQWWAGPWAFQSLTNRRAPMGKR